MRNMTRADLWLMLSLLSALAFPACSLDVATVVEEPTARSTRTRPSPTPAGESYSESHAGFAYVLPVGWELREVPGLKYKVAFGPIAEDFTPNINVVDEAFDGSLDDYVALNLKTIGKVIPDVVVVDQFEAETESGERFIRVAIEDTQNGMKLFQAFYFFSAGDRKFVVTYSRLADGDDRFDDEVDQCMLTFKYGE